jgi:mono/diheme cytochrome c family protein
MLRLVVLAVACTLSLLAQSPNYHVGRAATSDEIARRDISITPDGKGLPAGEGTAAEGAVIFENRCRECHGPKGEGADEAGFIGKPSDLLGDSPTKTVGSYWPYATTLWDYVNRAMPFDRPGELSEDQVYAVVAYLLHLNRIVGENDKLNAETLPAIKMPNRDGFISDPRPDAP